ncbi:alpha/beta hydrolase fold protein [Planoprotostelium fungivorum]|uniref:Alpha/beta hydrolase fold protein n=1 Tax=Planoprotostelium fungivorum TaxID=1890364 RepID=A0A2P6N4B5_9EUKA|nr:alpha/beta hydrolase fold protein [Planoprotostelium fungivorum]
MVAFRFWIKYLNHEKTNDNDSRRSNMMFRRSVQDPVRWRSFSSVNQIVKPPDLDAKKHPIFVLHGLFGSHQNWRAVGKRIAFNTCGGHIVTTPPTCSIVHLLILPQAPVHLIDLRNHGASPHTSSHTYDLMSQDIIRYMESTQTPVATLIGHSMGGKVAMHVALDQPERFDRLIVVDSSPVDYGEIGEFSRYVQLMRRLDVESLKSRKEANDRLAPHIPENGMRQFILLNLRDVSNTSNPQFRWRVNLDVLEQSLYHVRDFPDQGERRFERPTLFIGGGKIEFVPDAGHWVQAEKPDELVDLATRFLNEK